MTFDPKQAIAELRNTARTLSGPKLSFTERCAVYIFLHDDVEPKYVCQAFGITPATASLIHNNGKPGVRRYAQVRAEFERLGETAFRQRYATLALIERIARLKHDAVEPGDDRTPLGPNQRASKFAFENYGAFEANDGAGRSIWWRVDWTEGDGRGIAGRGGPGWRIIDCDRNGVIDNSQYEIPYRGREALDGTGEAEPKPFNTSTQAHDAVYKMLR